MERANAKISKGEEDVITSGDGGLQQVLLYGKDHSGDLHPIKITPQGDIDVEIAEPLGQRDNSTSFPVVISSEQLTHGSDDTLDSAAQIAIYARKDASPSGLRALKSTNDGTLYVRTNSTSFTKNNEIVNVPASGTGTSQAIQTASASVLGIAATSTNLTDEIEIYVSNDDNSYYPSGIKGTSGIVYANIVNPAFHYYKVIQTDTTGNPHTFNMICSKR
tara:strand:- start:106 stop:762 length:657 start_codon:yes stop_codon:yes gene_type:complete